MTTCHSPETCSGRFNLPGGKHGFMKIVILLQASYNTKSMGDCTNTMYSIYLLIKVTRIICTVGRVVMQDQYTNAISPVNLGDFFFMDINTNIILTI